MRWIYRQLGRLPPDVLRFAGRLQFKVPMLRRLLERAYEPLRAGEATVRHGQAAGLRFDPSGTNPGYVLGTTEPMIQEALARHLRPGATFFDIGANVGFFTVLGAKLVGPSGQVVAFEPAPEAAAALRRNVERNGFRNVEIMRAAVGDSMGEGELALAGMAESTGAKLIDGATPSSITVPIVALDRLVEEGSLTPPSVIKLDIEGAEIAALAGMRSLLEGTRPVLICETHGNSGEVRGLLKWLGYETGFLEPEGEAAWNAHVLGLPTLSPVPARG